ncbi:uncharacterized protein LOC118368474 isoform X4 [Oncorhynchus keta]|uniref:uncharacterized protein LOC118368474 isoform X4 n=1 Tax=Oncorhynchus keta TaxID=8018 RepID=UPI00227ABA74|nr:uncharacterized protein LOC118368474 isoform X4 [Oncorhynchus keta]
MDCEDSASMFLPHHPDPEPTKSLAPDCNGGTLALLLEDCINLLGPNAESMKLEEDCEDISSMSLPHQPEPNMPLKWVTVLLEDCRKSLSPGCNSGAQWTLLPLKRVRVQLEDCRKKLGPNAQSIQVEVVDSRGSSHPAQDPLPHAGVKPNQHGELGENSSASTEHGEISAPGELGGNSSATDLKLKDANKTKRPHHCSQCVHYEGCHGRWSLPSQ